MLLPIGLTLAIKVWKPYNFTILCWIFENISCLFIQNSIDFNIDGAIR